MQKLYIVDANIIIYLARIGKLESIFNRYRIYLTSIIYGEIKFYRDLNTGEKKSINLNKFRRNKKLIIIEPLEFIRVQKIREIVSPAGVLIDDGELESIAYIIENHGYLLCSGDEKAIIVLAFLGLSKNGISLEKLMGKFKNMEVQYTEEFFKKHIQFGKQQRIQFGDVI